MTERGAALSHSDGDLNPWLDWGPFSPTWRLCTPEFRPLPADRFAHTLFPPSAQGATTLVQHPQDEDWHHRGNRELLLLHFRPDEHYPWWWIPVSMSTTLPS